MKRKAISKGLRFTVFSRDNFTCRYCGRQSDIVPLHVDHLIPVASGGTNDVENLVTACADCNLAKGAKSLQCHVPTDTDRLRLAQEAAEQKKAAENAKAAAEARNFLRQQVVNFWCECTGKKSVSRWTINVITSYVSEFGADLVFQWIELASMRCIGDDIRMGKYVSGIRRKYMEEQKGAAQ